MAVPDCHKDQPKREVEKELTGRETEPWAIGCFKLDKTQIPKPYHNRLSAASSMTPTS